jgi:hypothetical protein
MHYAWAVPLLGLLIKTTTDMTEEEEIEREFAKVAAALERAEKEWNALSDDEKERRANSPEVLESRLWEDWTDCDPVTNPISHPDKSKTDR